MLIYVTEPNRIDMELVEFELAGKQAVLFHGSPSFTDSRKRDFETLLIRSETTVASTIRQYFPYLRNIIRIGTGLDSVDLAYCKQANISVFNAAGANADAVSEYIIAVILYVLRGLNTLTKKDLESWNRFKFMGQSMADQSVGLIGFGNVGRLLHKKLSGFSLKGFTVCDPYISDRSLPIGVEKVNSVDHILERCSIISLQVPMTAETAHFINADNLRRLNPGALLLNASRGGIVDEGAILDALATGQQFTYIADTISNEPKGDERLFRNDNVVITPHIASLTETSERDMVRTAIRNFINNVVVS